MRLASDDDLCGLGGGDDLWLGGSDSGGDDLLGLGSRDRGGLEGHRGIEWLWLLVDGEDLLRLLIDGSNNRLWLLCKSNSLVSLCRQLRLCLLLLVNDRDSSWL